MLCNMGYWLAGNGAHTFIILPGETIVYLMSPVSGGMFIVAVRLDGGSPCMDVKSAQAAPTPMFITLYPNNEDLVLKKEIHLNNLQVLTPFGIQIHAIYVYLICHRAGRPNHEYLHWILECALLVLPYSVKLICLLHASRHFPP